MKNLLDSKKFKMAGRPVITFLIGMPASGKSSWILKHRKDEIIISRDDIVDELRKDLGIAYNDTFKDNAFQDNVNKILNEREDLAIAARKDIIVDMTNFSMKWRKIILDKLPGEYIRKAVVFTVKRDELIRRALKRQEETGKEVPIHIIDSMLASYEPPDPSEKFDSIIYK